MTFDLPAILLVLMIIIIAISLYITHRNCDTTFDLTDLITYKGRVDNAKFCQIGAFFLSSWVIYYMTLNNRLTEWAFGLYMAAWVGARVASMLAGLKGAKEPPTTVNRSQEISINPPGKVL